jgi:hypothetical protein
MEDDVAIFSMVLTWLGNLLGGPFAKAAVQAYQAKLSSDNSAENISAGLAARELTVQQRELELQTQLRIAEIGKWYEPDKLMGYAVAFYFGKLLIWDKVLGLGSTDPLAGFAATTANLIVACYFTKRGFENIARIIKR